MLYCACAFENFYDLLPENHLLEVGLKGHMSCWQFVNTTKKYLVGFHCFVTFHFCFTNFHCNENSALIL